MAKKALIILTSAAKMGDTGKPTGFDWEEFALPYWALRDAGFEIDLASVKGGEPPADPNSIRDSDRADAVHRFKDDDSAMGDLGDTKRVADVDGADYDLVYLPGGHGAMWDFAQTREVGETVGTAWETGAIVASVCHGPAGLAEARLSDGSHLVHGQRMCTFTNAEEEAAGVTDIVPYLLETRLESHGAMIEKTDPFEAQSFREGRLVTGQNPQSVRQLVALIFEALEARDAA